MMLGLTKKDLYMTRSSQIIFILSSAMYIVMYIFIKEVIFEGYIRDTAFSRTALSCFPLIIALEFNCKNLTADRLLRHSEKFFNSMPVSASEVVMSKFSGSIIVTTYGLVLSTLSLLIFAHSDGVTFRFAECKTVIAVYCIILIVLAFQMPVLICTGNELLSLVLPFNLIITIPVLLLIIWQMDINEFIAHCIRYTKNHAIFYRYCLPVLFFITLAMLVISAGISVNLYKRREF